MLYMCEAMVQLPHSSARRKAVYTMCGAVPVEVHHKLTRARGGLILDAAGEDYHLIKLCRKHHNWAHLHLAEAVESGLMLKGYVTTNTMTGEPFYDGPDPYLKEKYGATDAWLA